ncbi:SusC/RagA family TonB-linked outer membrane protein [Carboxylicivirga sediminis]|uniref:SusC/RagA family TonB-linked outer membrane protein n=1 Tax=Carboxylicivirga sediminis TaxID=2006564 RepID=A0A941IYL6_9BACT|nr:SusC/RagA family TonB-linked outer membrane protein [Carboxylicivirga sediminis]MBR8538021.1 SusC/RagA family TonB-linked outer membrane protein [Carboxylicivirga sediminis]
MKKIFYSILLLFVSTLMMAQNPVKVAGKVTGTDNIGIPGVSVIIKGTTTGTITDFDGNYVVNATPDNIIEFSFIGYESQEVVVGTQTTLNIVLQESVELVDEVVVVGYGTQKVKDLTSAITTVASEELAKTPAATAMQALQGKVGGLQVVSSGQPGNQPTVRVRGIGSFQSAGQNPLYVVDGMFYDNIDFLNISEIASVSVLKDASAAAIYGVRAANGVILIETKSGSKGKTEVEYDGYYGYQVAQNVLKMANAEQFTNMALESGSDVDYNFVLNAMQKYGRSRVNPNVPDVNTDWYDEILRPAPIQNHSLSARGGTENVKYALGTSYFKQDGIMDVENYYERFNLTAKIDAKANQWLSYGGNVVFSNATKKDPNNDAWKQAYLAVPILPVYDQDYLGVSTPDNFADAQLLGYRGHQNPFPSMLYNDRQLDIMKVNANFYAQIDLIPSKLTFKTSYNHAYTDLNQRNVDFPFYINDNWFREFYTEGEDESVEYRADFVKVRKQNSTYSNKIWDNVLTYSDSFGAHNISVMAGSSYRQETSHNLWGSAEDVPAEKEQYWYIDAGQNNDSHLTGDGGAKYYGQSYFSRLSYNFNGKYMLYATMRADGSNKFENTWAYFPAVGAGWVLSEENFLKNNDYIDFLKLRFGWGQLGNDKIPRSDGSAATYINYVALGDQRAAGTVTTNNINILRWEVTEETNVGLSANMLGNRLGIEADYYTRDTKDAAIYVNTPVIMGGGLKSAGVIRNSGFELAVNWSDNITSDLSYIVGATLSTNKNEVRELYGQDYIDGGSAEFRQRTMVGEPLLAFYGWEVAGVYQNQAEIDADPIAIANGLEPGDFKYKDQQKEGEEGYGVIDDNDRVILGSYFPTLMYGANLGIKYKNLQLTTNIMGQSGNKILNRKRGEVIWTNDTNWDADLATNRWHGEGTSNEYPSSKGLRKSWNQKMSDYLVEDGAFFRIQNVQLAYTLSNKSLFGVEMPDARISFTAERPLTVFSYNGFSPEVNNGIDNQVHPVPAIYTVGLNLKF